MTERHNPVKEEVFKHFDISPDYSKRDICQDKNLNPVLVREVAGKIIKESSQK